MNKIIKISKLGLAIVFVAFTTQSCKDLTEVTEDSLTSDNFPKTEEQFIAALGAAYTDLYGYGSHNSYLSDNEVSTDEIMIPQRGGDWYDGGQWLRMHRHEFTPTEESFNNGWNSLFKGVSDCNRLIELFSSIDNPNAPAYIAELRGLRALNYFFLMDLFGNVPIVTKFKEAESAPATKPRAEVYAFIESEINDIDDLLTKTNGGAAYARINYWTVKTILAKMYLNAAQYKGGAAELDKCIAVCNEIMDSGKFSLEGNYRSMFAADNGGSKETIFAVPYDRVFAQGFNLPQMTLHYASRATYDLEQQPWNGYCSLADFYNAYEDADVRKANLIAGPQFGSDGVRLQDSGAEANDPDGADLTFTPEINEHFPNCLRQAGVRVGKYEYRKGATPNLDNDFPIFRYTDVVMMKAEALWRKSSSDANALALINQIRERAKVSPFASLTADNLLAERGREFFYENWRRNDMIRFGKFNDPREFKPGTSDSHFNIFPIPKPQIDANPNLDQNPGY